MDPLEEIHEQLIDHIDALTAGMDTATTFEGRRNLEYARHKLELAVEAVGLAISFEDADALHRHLRAMGQTTLDELVKEVAVA